jgi:copper resistance protein B
MRPLVLAVGLMGLASPALAQHADHPMPPPGSPPAASPTSMPAMTQGESPAVAEDEPVMEAMAWPDSVRADEDAVPPAGNAPPPPAPTDWAADRQFDPARMAASRETLTAEHGGGGLHSKVMLNLGEYQVRKGENGYRWEGEAWFGGDLNRLVIKTEGAGGERSGVSDAEVQFLYSRAISPYFDLQAGLRQDFEPQPRRTWLTVGVEGEAAYWVDTQAALFLSNKGELTGRGEAAYDFRLTQAWILQPRVEANLSAQDIPEIGVGSGLSSLEAGLRLRYEFRREFAPYIGISFDRKFGRTASLARLAGEDVEDASLVIGLRAWF